MLRRSMPEGWIPSNLVADVYLKETSGFKREYRKFPDGETKSHLEFIGVDMLQTTGSQQEFVSFFENNRLFMIHQDNVAFVVIYLNQAIPDSRQQSCENFYSSLNDEDEDEDEDEEDDE
jgi:hypothetical protein